MDIKHQDIELLWVEARLFNNKFLFGVVYRPPNSYAWFWDSFQYIVDQDRNTGIDKTIIMGDFNADPTTSHGRKMIDFYIINNLSVHIHGPTRITETSSTCLDQIITNIPKFVSNVNVSIPLANCGHPVFSENLLFRLKKNSCQ